jgi:hypothetical protein
MKARHSRGHFTLGELADFARKTGPDSKLEAMKEHLENCGKCAKAADTWRRVSDVARRLPSPEPPAAAVRNAKAFFSAHKPQRSKAVRSIVAELLFDSSLVPLQAGVRSVASASRQLLFGSGDYRVDLRIEPQDDQEQVSFLGQVLHTTDAALQLGSVPVAIVQGRKVVAKSQTNHLGEFHLQCELKPRLELRVMLPDSQVAIPLIEPVREGIQADSYLIGDTAFRGTSTRRRRLF